MFWLPTHYNFSTTGMAVEHIEILFHRYNLTPKSMPVLKNAEVITCNRRFLQNSLKSMTVIPAQLGIQRFPGFIKIWIPVFTRMTTFARGSQVNNLDISVKLLLKRFKHRHRIDEFSGVIKLEEGVIDYCSYGVWSGIQRAIRRGEIIVLYSANDGKRW